MPYIQKHGDQAGKKSTVALGVQPEDFHQKSIYGGEHETVHLYSFVGAVAYLLKGENTVLIRAVARCQSPILYGKSMRE